jgi:uncharacterized tellurite resistance protein B-like protein
MLETFTMQQQTETILTSYSEKEKAAYLGALASLATADREASEEEITHIQEMAHAIGLSSEDEQQVLHAARDASGEDLKTNLSLLKGSDLRYSLITDMIALAKADGSYSEEEKTNIQKIANYLQVDGRQFEVLDQYVEKASQHEDSPEQMSKPGFLDSLGMRNQFSNAGFSMGSLGKGIFGMLGPLLLGGMAAKTLGGNRRNAGFGGGGIGGMLGGMLGGNSGMGGFGGTGGLGSLISGINRGRSSGGIGGMLGRLLR